MKHDLDSLNLSARTSNRLNTKKESAKRKSNQQQLY